MFPRQGRKWLSRSSHVLLSVECYTYPYRITKAEAWMNNARRTVFMETSFLVNIMANVLRTAVELSMMEEFPLRAD